MLPLRPVRPFVMSVLESLPALRGAAGARLVGRGPARVRSVVRAGLLSLPGLPVWLVRPLPLRLRLRMPLDILAWVVVTPRVTTRHLTVTALLSRAFRDWVRDRGLHQVLTGLALSMVVALPLLLWVRRKTIALVLLTRLIWIGMIRSGLCFASSGISTVWRNRQV